MRPTESGGSSLRLLPALILAAGCGGGDSPGVMRPPPGPPPPPAPVPTTVSVTPATASLTALGRTVQLAAKVRDQGGQILSAVTVTWSSSSPSVATVAANGLVTAVGRGIATITAAAGNATGSARVTVEQAAARVTVDPPALDFDALGDTIRATATALDEDEHPIPMPAVTWASDDAAVATVDSTGLATATGEGTATITATVGTASGEAQVEVEQVPDSLQVTSPGSALAVGDSMQFTATVFDRNGHPVGGLTFEWSSSDPAIATVDERGWVMGIAEGSADITAVAGELRASKTLAVQGEADLMRGALIALYESTDGPNWKQNENWLSDAPLADWHGISTDAEGRVTQLALVDNGLRGTIPPQIGNLRALRSLWLYSNELSGSIPPELGRLTELVTLWLQYNDLSGAVPSELGNLASLEAAWLYNNRLSGPIPPELGNLSNLTELLLHENRLRGQVPAELGKLTKLTRLQLNDNSGLSGLLPLELAGLGSLTDLLLEGTGLCAANDPDFRGWRAGLAVAEVALCRQGGAPFYLIQAVQSLETPVPLVAGKDALLRVFPFAVQSTDERIPPVRATFYDQGSLVHEMEIPAGSAVLPTEFADGPLEESANGLVPGSVLQPGVEMVIEVDPDTTVTLSLGVHERIPETGRLALEVHEMPPLHLTVVPYLWRSDPDTAFARQVGELTAEHETLWETRNLLPVGDLDLRTHEPVWTDLDPIFENSMALLREVEALRLMEGSSRRYMGMLRSCVSTTLHRSRDQPAEDVGRRTTGLHMPPVIGVVAVGLTRSRTSPRIPSRRRTASACRSAMGSRSGLAARTSRAHRTAPTPSEASAAVQPMPQSRSARGIERGGDTGSATATAADPACGNGVSGAAIVRGASLATSSAGASTNGDGRCGAGLPGEGRMGTSHEGPRRLRTGSPSRRAKVIVHSRWRTPAEPFRASHARASAADSRIVTLTTRPGMLRESGASSESIIVLPRTPGRSAP
ncbi:Ig-like domain-containing protein [Candidatus Palauibacter sp.]|uniref:Ig-like domain-containing protein n=1 Tax=Candidatus Palauibacter sp. TaxID=3101350 RepID=UPI003B01C62D